AEDLPRGETPPAGPHPGGDQPAQPGAGAVSRPVGPGEEQGQRHPRRGDGPDPSRSGGLQGDRATVGARMDRKRVLIVEDDRSIREGLADALAFQGYLALQAERGDTGLQKALLGGCDLVILDLVLPGADGLAVLREIRRARPTLPVIILTARGAEADRVRGLREGADDYVVKPFGIRELLARVDAVLRRSPERPSDIRRLEIPGGWVDLERREVHFEKGPGCDLSLREVELLRYL